MKKNELIQKLQEIEGNPDVISYNGFVDDWQDIEAPIITELYRLSKRQKIKYINLERYAQEGEPLSEDEEMEQEDWVLENSYTSKYEDRKRVIVLQAKIRDRIYNDRFGKVRY